MYVSMNVFVGRYGAGYDLAARRKNATRESTATLKAWLNEHKKNPYPTKGEKIMLAIITKMTLTQVSTWFANARRRLKKENKMTWEPKNKTDDDDDAMLSDDEKDKEDQDEKMKSLKGSLSSISMIHLVVGLINTHPFKYLKRGRTTRCWFYKYGFGELLIKYCPLLPCECYAPS